MTYKQKLESQIAFARQRMQEAQSIDRTREVDTWNGYRQGLKYALAELEGYGYLKEPVLRGTDVVSEQDDCLYPNCKCFPVEPNACKKKQCTCDDQDLRPLGQCICGADKVAPI